MMSKMVSGWICLLMLVLNFAIFAQDEEKPVYGWKNAAIGNLSFTQTSFDNWQQGGENSWSWVFNFNARFLYSQPKFDWRTINKLEYGKTKVGDDESKKAGDEIFLETSLIYKQGWKVNPYVAASGRTQFAKGYDFSTEPDKTLISQFMNPGYFMESVGLEYHNEERFRTRLGVALKQTVVTEEKFAPKYTDKSDSEKLEKVRAENGLESVSYFSQQFTEATVYATSLELFSNLKRFDEIDVRWDHLLTTEITKYFAFAFTFQLFYDKDLSFKRQLKNVLGIGITYTFFGKKEDFE